MGSFGGLFKGLAAVVVSVLALGLFSAAAGPTASFKMTPDGNPAVGQSVQFTETSTGGPQSWSWDFGDAQTSTQQNPTHAYGAPGTFQVSLTATNASGSTQSVQPVVVSPSDTLQLNNKESHAFTVTLHATDQRTGNQGAGQAIPQNDLFGYFSIPDLTHNPDNPEVFVKILDGRTINGEFWVFYGHLTDLIYDLTVTEVSTGLVKTYHKDAGARAPGDADTSGFHPTPTPTGSSATATPPATQTPTPTPTSPPLIIVDLVASDFRWDFNGAGATFTFRIAQPYQLRISHASGTAHQFTGLPSLGCPGSSLTSTVTCNFTPTAAQTGSYTFGCANSSCGIGHDNMQNGMVFVLP